VLLLAGLSANSASAQDWCGGKAPVQGWGDGCPDLWTPNDVNVVYFDQVPGAVSSGVGASPAGNYWVFIEWESNRRWAIRTIEDGENDDFCAQENTPSASCPHSARWMCTDGLMLRTSPDTTYWRSGLRARYDLFLEDILGPYNKSDNDGNSRHDWEWLSDETGGHCRTWATRKTPIIEALYLIQWNGTPLSSVYQTQWLEPDAAGGDDHSIKRNIDVGKALTQCLQRNFQDAPPGGYPARYQITGPNGGSGSLFSYICQGNDPACTSPGDYKIEIYFNVFCRIMRTTWPSGTATDWMNERDTFRSWVNADDLAMYGGQDGGPTRPRWSINAVFGKGKRF
jgi:hypothetical protein